MGKLIVLEGVDGSGKSTQFRLLTQRLEGEGIPFSRLVFPQYKEESSALIRMYLKGEFGSQPGDVNAYAASTFFAVDRYASYQKGWRKTYEEGGLILSDRYTTSNAVHQGSKLTGEARQSFFQWLSDFEFVRLGLPAPDLVLYLDVPVELSEAMLRRREKQTHTNADIHEQNSEYLRACQESGRAAAVAYGWKIVHCVHQGKMRAPEDIHEEIYRLVKHCMED